MRLKEDIFRMKEMMNRLRNYFISGLVVFLPLAADPRLREQTKRKLCNVFVPQLSGAGDGFHHLGFQRRDHFH